MEPNKVFKVMDEALYQKFDKHFSDPQRNVFLESWVGSTYEEMAEKLDYTPSYLSRTIGPELWGLLSKVLEEEVTKPNFRWAVTRYVEAKDFNPEKSPNLSPGTESSEIVVRGEFMNGERQVEPLKSAETTYQEILSNIETGSLEAGDIVQRAHHSKEQVMLKSVTAESIKLGNLIQEA